MKSIKQKPLVYQLKCAIIKAEEISPKSVRSGRLLEKDRADFILCQL